MCGIAGIANLDGSAVSKDLVQSVEAMILTLRHRGPDSSGVAHLGACVLGGCRLSILDLSSLSNQPFKSSDSDCTVVLNGEIFNYLELRDILKHRGHRFTSDGDTEVVVHAYEEWGVECLQRLNGMFAFAVFDAKNGEVLLARDRFGIKPLYFSTADRLLLFASEPVPLFESKLVANELNGRVIADYLRFGVTDYGSGTFFAGIQQVLPGHYVMVSGASVSIHQWFQLSTNMIGAGSGENAPALVQAFRNSLTESVRLRMRSDVPVGILLSGGVDSSTVACVASMLPGHKSLHAFVASFPGAPIDEGQFAKLVASRCEMGLTLEDAGMVDLASVNQCIRDQGEPVISPSVVAQWLVMRATSQHGIRVVLTGQGADELLAGYEYLDAYVLGDLLAGGQIGAAARYLLAPRNVRRLPVLVAGSTLARLPGRVRLLLWRKPWLRVSRGRPPSEYELELVRCRSLREMIRFHLIRRLPELLRYQDRSSMAFSLETREPFLDHLLVEFSTRLPNELISASSGRKQILRLASESLIPSEILARREKVGFQTPEDWLRTAEFRLAYSRLCKGAPQVLRQWVDFGKAERLVARRSSALRMKDIWRIYNLLAWYELVVRPVLESGPRATAVLKTSGEQPSTSAERQKGA